MLSASGVPRALRCVASLVLPRTLVASDYAEAGIEWHAENESAADTGGELPDAVSALILEDDELVTEQPFAYNVATDTARQLPRGKRRDYNTTPFEIPGTPDLVIRGNGRVVVVDYKGIAEVDSAERNAQVATYALMVARAWGVDEVEIAIVYRASWRRPSYATLTALDLDAHASRLKQLQLDVTKARENPLAWVRSGSWCRFCEAALGCPEWTALRKQAANGELAVVVEAAIPFPDDNEAADAWDLLQRIKMLAGRLEGALRMRAKERPIPLPDGMVLAEVEKEGKRKIDADKAYALMRERFGQEIADAAVRRSVAQSWIESALKDAGVKGAAKHKDSIVKQLEESGAVTRDVKFAVEVVPMARLKALP